MAEVRIRIGAAIDPSVARSFDQVEQRAAKSATRVRDALGRASKGQSQDAQRAAEKAAAADQRKGEAQVRSAERINAQIARIEARAAADGERRRQAQVRADQRAFDERLRASKKAHDAEERDIMRVAQAAERADKRKAAAQQRESAASRTAFGREFGHRAVSNFGQMARFGMGVAGQVARGAGVDLDLGSSMARNVELEKQAIDLSNSGYDPNAKPGTAASKRVDAGDIQRDVKTAADANAFSRTETMAGLQSFVGKTGDLETGRKVLADLGRLSKATGTDLGDMVDAAGDVSNALGDMADKGEKAKRVAAVMKSIAGQGKLGAVEIKDLASQMAKLGSGATAFEGKADDNVALMGAFAQLARSKGGATSANIAAGSVTSMVNTLKTPARMKAFAAEGIDVVNKDTGMLRNPQQILMAALAKTGGDPERLKKMYSNVQGARAIEGSAQTFRAARNDALAKGGTQEQATKAGLAAVSDEFDRLKRVAMGEGEIRDSLNRSLSSQSAKAQQFNNRMDDVTAKLQADLTPALEKAAPGLIKLADAAAKLISWAAGNPWAAAGAAAGAALTKALIETVVSQGLAGLLKRAVGGGGGGMPVPGGANAMGTGGKALAVGAAAVVGFGIGKELHDASASADDRGEARTRASKIGAENASHALRMTAGQQFHDDPEAMARAQATLAEGKKRAAELESRIGNADKGYWNGYVSHAVNFATNGAAGASLDQQGQIDADKAEKGKMVAELAELKAEMARVSAKLAGELRVTVTNQPTPGVDPSGRDPKPGKN